MNNINDDIKYYKTEEGKFAARTPYHADLPPKFRALGGRWNPVSHVWIFDPRDKDRVKEVVESIFGVVEPSGKLVTLRYRASRENGDRGQSVTLAGREIARRPYRDSEVRLTAGTVIIEGGFPSSGGSGKYPQLFNTNDEYAVLEIRDVDANIAVKMVEQGAEIIS